MKITIETPQPGEEDEIIIRCAAIDDGIMEFIYALKTGREKLTAYSDKGIAMLPPKDIYYFESVDNRVFVYMAEEVYETRMKLYELEKSLLNTDFFRASKSTIINLANVKNLSPALAGRFEAHMKNGEALIISRQYVQDLKRRLGLKN